MWMCCTEPRTFHSSCCPASEGAGGDEELGGTELRQLTQTSQRDIPYHTAPCWAIRLGGAGFGGHRCLGIGQQVVNIHTYENTNTERCNPTPPATVLQYLGLQSILWQAGSIPAQPACHAGGAVSPGQAAVLGVAQRLSTAGPTPQLGTDILLRSVGAVLEVFAKDLLALLVQAVQGPSAG